MQVGRESEVISENLKPSGGASETDSPFKLRQTMDFNPTFKSIGNSKNSPGQQDSMRIKSQTGGNQLEPSAYEKNSTFLIKEHPGRKSPFSLISPGLHGTSSNSEAARIVPHSAKGVMSMHGHGLVGRQAADQDQIEVDLASLGQDARHLTGNSDSLSSQPFSPFNLKPEDREEDPTTAEPSNAFGSMLEESDAGTRLQSKTHFGTPRHPAEAETDEAIPEDYIPRRRRCLTGYEFRSVLTEKYNELKESHGNDPYFYRNLNFEDQYLKPNVKPPISKISDPILKEFFSRFAKGGSIDASHFPKLIEEIYQFEKKPIPNYLQCLYLMSKYDTNKDGQIDYGEFKAMMAEL